MEPIELVPMPLNPMSGNRGNIPTIHSWILDKDREDSLIGTKEDEDEALTDFKVLKRSLMTVTNFSNLFKHNLIEKLFEVLL